ncbi:MAG: hypothetical protein JNJ70_21945 [Verrucomicrobiales bacterium]|nr:hypothetical protein [Verrucomicrobiales bacterium]
MKIRALLFASLFAAAVCLSAETPGPPIVRDLLAPPSFFRDPVTKAPVDPRERLAAEGITLGNDESIAYDPATSRLFVRANVETIYRLQKLLEAEMRKGSALVALTHGILETSGPLLSDEAAETPSLVSIRVLTTDEQLENLVIRAREVSSGTVQPGPTITAKSEETTETRIGDALTRNVPVISADASTVEMTLTLLHGPAGADPQIIGETSVAIPSGGSVAIEEWLGKDSWRTRLITALVVDPAGKPFPSKETTGLPGEEREGLGGSLFPGPVPVPALEKVRDIILPSVVFQETPLLEAIALLKKASIEHDRSLPESQRGIDIRYWYTSPDSLAQKPVTLRLSNVPLIEAIREVVSLAGCDYRIEGGSVLIGVFPQRLDLSGAEEIWYAAFLRGTEADELEKAGESVEARSKRLQALKLYEALRERYPDFQTKAAAARMARLKEILAKE